jgi:hypothetical protein
VAHAKESDADDAYVNGKGLMFICQICARSSRGRRGKGWNVDVVVGIVRKGMKEQREEMEATTQRCLDLNLTCFPPGTCVYRHIDLSHR